MKEQITERFLPSSATQNVVEPLFGLEDRNARFSKEIKKTKHCTSSMLDFETTHRISYSDEIGDDFSFKAMYLSRDIHEYTKYLSEVLKFHKKLNVYNFTMSDKQESQPEIQTKTEYATNSYFHETSASNKQLLKNLQQDLYFFNCLTLSVKELSKSFVANSAISFNFIKQNKMQKIIPYRVLDAPSLRNDYYSNLISWSPVNGSVAVGLGSSVHISTSKRGSFGLLASSYLSNLNDYTTSIAFSPHKEYLLIGTKHGKIILLSQNKNKSEKSDNLNYPLILAEYNTKSCKSICCIKWFENKKQNYFLCGTEKGEVICMKVEYFWLDSNKQRNNFIERLGDNMEAQTSNMAHVAVSQHHHKLSKSEHNNDDDNNNSDGITNHATMIEDMLDLSRDQRVTERDTISLFNNISFDRESLVSYDDFLMSLRSGSPHTGENTPESLFSESEVEENVQQIHQNSDNTLSVSFSVDNTENLSKAKKLRAYRFKDQKHKKSYQLVEISFFKSQTQQVCGIDINDKIQNSNIQVAIGGNDNSCTIWDITCITEPKKQFVLPHKAAVKAIEFCPWSNNLLATGAGSKDRCIRFWHSQTGILLKEIKTEGQITSLHWSTKKRQIAASFGYVNPDTPLLLKVYSYPSMLPLKHVNVPKNVRVLSSVLSPDKTCICIATNDETVRFYKLWNTRDTEINESQASGIYNSPLVEHCENIVKLEKIIR